jgi:uncharacterized protein
MNSTAATRMPRSPAPVLMATDPAPAAASASAIYVGHISHRRHRPHPHRFGYPLFMMYLDLADIGACFAGRWLWSVNRRNLAEFRRSDFLGPADIPLDQAVRDRVEQETGQRPGGPIRMLAHLRYFGLSFNPVAFYYCFAGDGTTLETIVAEITNTPWRERHAYVLPLSEATGQGRMHAWEFAKQFHVSPFLPMDRRYHWRFSHPGDKLRVHMRVIADAATEFDASLRLQRRPLSGWGLARSLLRFPLMSLQVVLAIHWQAFFIWCKRNPVYDHPHNGKPK